ncbi:MAG: hypothetical protein KAJ23_17195, partial [Maribacter sp.]|nr:hypothetical protein [Maribacter sp.]
MAGPIIAFDHTDAGDDPFSGLITHRMRSKLYQNKKGGLSKKIKILTLKDWAIAFHRTPCCAFVIFL